VETLQEAISSLGRPYQQRDTLYRHLPTSKLTAMVSG